MVDNMMAAADDIACMFGVCRLRVRQIAKNIGIRGMFSAAHRPPPVESLAALVFTAAAAGKARHVAAVVEHIDDMRPRTFEISPPASFLRRVAGLSAIWADDAGEKLSPVSALAATISAAAAGDLDGYDGEIMVRGVNPAATPYSASFDLHWTDPDELMTGGDDAATSRFLADRIHIRFGAARPGGLKKPALESITLIDLGGVAQWAKRHAQQSAGVAP